MSFGLLKILTEFQKNFYDCPSSAAYSSLTLCAKAWPGFNLAGQAGALNVQILIVTCSMFLNTRLPGRAI